MFVHKYCSSPRNMRRVYFIETSDFAITFIPVQLEGEEINIHIEPLDCSL